MATAADRVEACPPTDDADAVDDCAWMDERQAAVDRVMEDHLVEIDAWTIATTIEK